MYFSAIFYKLDFGGLPCFCVLLIGYVCSLDVYSNNEIKRSCLILYQCSYSKNSQNSLIAW